jgi:hypothetical protein
MESGRIEENSTAAVEMSPFLRFINIFYSPKEVFASLATSKWAWIAPTILIFLVGLASYPFIKTIMADERVRSMETSPLFERIPEAQKEEIFESTRESIENPPWYQWILGALAGFIPVFVAGGIMLLIGNLILGGETRFWKMLNVFAFSSLISIPESIIKVPLIYSKETLDIRTSLAIILPSDSTASFTHAFLNNIDIFSIWMVSLVVIGMGVYLQKISVKKIAVWISIFWLIWVFINSTIEYFFGGGFGL